MGKTLYNNTFYKNEGTSAASASKIVLPYILDSLGSRSVVDFGCGTGEWCLVAKETGKVDKVLGIDGEYARSFVKLNDDEFMSADLTKEVRLDGKYDLAISLEVAEHINPEYANTFVKNLTQSSDIVLFSAAIPLQRGTNHVNEQYPSYWKKIFEEYGFKCVDCIRDKFWDDNRVDFFYRQNMFIYCREDLCEEVRMKFNEGAYPRLDCVHPEMFEYRVKCQYLFPFELVNKGESVCIWGGG